MAGTASAKEDARSAMAKIIRVIILSAGVIKSMHIYKTTNNLPAYSVPMLQHFLHNKKIVIIIMRRSS